MLAIAFTFAAALSGDPRPTGVVSCELLKVRDEERRLGPSPAVGEADSANVKAEGDKGALHFLTLRCGVRRYVARLAGELPKLATGESNPGGLKVRFQGDRVFFKLQGGKEAEAAYAEAERPSPAPKPAAPQKP